jgi:hypothetical protein
MVNKTTQHKNSVSPRYAAAGVLPKILLLPVLRLAQSTNAAPQTDQSLNFLSLHLAPLMLIFHYRFDRIKTGGGRPDRNVDAVVRS